MKTLNEMRAERKSLSTKLHALVKDHPQDKAWEKEHQDKYDAMVRDIENLDAQIDRHVKAENLLAGQKLAAQERAAREGISEDEAEHKNISDKGAFRNWLRGGVNALNDEQREALQNRIQSPQNTMSTSTGSEGGYLTQEELAPSIAEALKAFGGMRTLATVIRSATGSTIPWPTANATTEEGEWLAQNAEADDEDTAFGVRPIDTWKVSSKTVAVPFELLQDSQFDIEGYVNRLIGTRIARTSEGAFINGTGTSQPHGILADVTSGKVGANGQTTTITVDDLIDLEHSIDPAYRMSSQCGFMFNDAVLKVVKKLKDSQNRPLWLPGYDSGDPNTILGYAYAINQNMPVMAANAKSVLFGDFSKYIVRDVMQMMYFRFTDSAYTRKGQVGFLAMMRVGGRYIDVGGAVKYYQNSAS